MPRKTLKEVVSRSREGRCFDSEGIRKITQKLVLCKNSELVMKYCANYNLKAEEWCAELMKAMELPNEEFSYLYLIRKLDQQALIKGVNDDILFYLTSIFLFPSKISEPYMNVAVVDLLKEAGLESTYDRWFRKDAELFKKQNGREVRVRDVLEGCMNGFGNFKFRIIAHPCEIVLKPDIPEHISKPFARLPIDCSQFDAERILWKSSVVWVWTLMVQAPVRISNQMADFKLVRKETK